MICNCPGVDRCKANLIVIPFYGFLWISCAHDAAGGFGSGLLQLKKLCTLRHRYSDAPSEGSCAHLQYLKPIPQSSTICLLCWDEEGWYGE